MKINVNTGSKDLGTVLLFWFGVFNSLAGAAHSAKEVPVHAVNGVLGHEVRLPCDISSAEAPDQNEDYVVLVLWYKGDKPTPIYSVDARDKESFEYAVEWSEDAKLGSRSKFMPKFRPAVLAIKNITIEDGGIYRCRVDFRLAQTRNSKVNVTIIIPPEKIEIFDEKSKLRTSVVGPYTQGSKINLRCVVYGGKPEPVILWYKDNQLISNESQVSGSLKQSSILIESLNRSDLNSQLTCKSYNNNKSKPITATVQVDMNFEPLDVRIIDVGQPLTADRKYHLLCQSTGSRPPAKITWWKDGRRLDKTIETTSNDGNTTTSTLMMTPTKQDSGSYLSCKAENPVIRAKPLETGWKLEIYYVPETMLVLGTSLSANSIKEGMDVYFDCVIRSLPPVYKVEWRKDGQTLHHNVNNGVIISNRSLVLQKVTRLSGGNYTCIGYNSEGDGISSPLYLNVMYAPICKSQQTRVYGIAKLEKANVSCQVDANPSNVTFSWAFNSSVGRIEIPPDRVSNSGTRSLVSHRPTSDLDYGTLFCSAVNKVGRQKSPCVFIVIAAAKPDPVVDCSIHNITTTSFIVQCSEGFDGGIRQTFVLQVLDKDGQGTFNLTAPHPSFNVTDLQSGTQYSLAIWSANGKGESEPFLTEVTTHGRSLLQIDKSVKNTIQSNYEDPPEYVLWMIIILTVGILVAFISIWVATYRSYEYCLRLLRAASRRRNQSNNDHMSNSEKGPGSPNYISDEGDLKAHENPLYGEIENDDADPDIIPQPVVTEYVPICRRKQHISTIDSSPSPTQNLLVSSSVPIVYPNYCTLNVGAIPLQQFTRVVSNTSPRYDEGSHMKIPNSNSHNVWPLYGAQNCIYHTLPHRIKSVANSTIIEEEIPSSSNKQESSV